ncbi:hypothetical protein LTR66_016558 [Elasticomyces elasticus]|nr:hypothetical protein LTR66_016558 [Elasticomyces elasticus]
MPKLSVTRRTIARPQVSEDELKPAEPQGPAILAQERAQSSINVEQLAQHLLHRNDFLARQKKILGVIEKRPYFSKKNQLNITRPDRYHLGLARAKELRRLSLKYGWNFDDYKMADYLTDEMAAYALQTIMFATSIREQCNDEQKAYWLPKVENWEIIGCYGQTELGHGSNVKGIEWQARWNPETKDFTIHSPTLTASKWWNGSLGRTANHAIVVAQLMLPDKKTGKLKSHGPHQFIVQIRDMKTNKPLEGIVIGDIGAKYGYAAMDNGYMLFKNYRVPHSALLARYSGVDSTSGMYIPANNQAVVYGSLTYVRAQIIMHARLVLARACTIAVRYTSIRRQFADRDAKGKSEEVAVLNYPTVQIRILPLLATTYALHYTGEAMYNLYCILPAIVICSLSAQSPPTIPPLPIPAPKTRLPYPCQTPRSRNGMRSDVTKAAIHVSPPPPIPATTLPKINHSADGATPHIVVPIAKKILLKSRPYRRLNMSVSLPDRG